MRSLKTLVLALGGVVAALFGVFFVVVPAMPGPAIAGDTLQPDQAAKRLTPASELVAGRDAKPAGKTPQSPPHFPNQDFSPSENLRITRDFVYRLLPGAPARLNDQRLLLLVGVVELRI